MHPITALMLVEGIERDRRQAAARHKRRRPQPRPHTPSHRSHWNEMLRVYRLGFAAKP